MLCRCIALWAAFGWAVATRAAAPQVGKPAPALHLETVLPPLPGAPPSWDTLKGKAVVLEFWATWCAPCIEQIPHLNGLVTKFAGRPIQFISITDEERPIVSKFLAARPISGWVVLDPGRSQFDAYTVTGIPHTVLVDANGIIAGITEPSEVTEVVVNNLLDGKPLGIPAREPSTPVNIRSDAAGALLDIIIKASSTGHITMSSSPGRMTFSGASLRSILANAYQVRPHRIAAGEWADDMKYDIGVAMPSASQSQVRPLLQNALLAAFRIQVRRETQELDVLVLTAPDGQQAGLRDSASTGGNMPRSEAGKFSAINMNLSGLANALEDRLNGIVVDETKLAGRFDLELHWDAAHPESIKRAVQEQLGLELTPAKRAVEMLVLEKHAEGTAH